MNDRQRELARIRQARRRARLKEEGTSVTVTLTKQEEAMLQELCRVRRPGRTPYSRGLTLSGTKTHVKGFWS